MPVFGKKSVEAKRANAFQYRLTLEKNFFFMLLVNIKYFKQVLKMYEHTMYCTVHAHGQQNRVEIMKNIYTEGQIWCGVE